MYRLKRGRASTGYAREMPGAQTRTSYHHGALRDELIRAFVALIEAEGIGAVSLRRVAREAGVSPGAPYHHFADRSALLMAISVQGYELLGQRLRGARAPAATALRPVPGIVALWLDGPLEARCESLGTTPEILVTQITALLEQLLAGHTETRAP